MEDWRNAFIWRLTVKSEYRRQWIGKMLMKEAENIVRNRWIKEIWWFVAIKNKELQKRYKKQNYIKWSDFKFIYKKLN